MAELTKNTPTPETQKERWVKYGANVGLTVIVVIALALIVTYLASAHDRRIDTTTSGVYSLKPQTVNIISDNKQKIKIVALYPRLKGDDETKQQDYFQPVSDLIEEYQRKGKNIEVDFIDPASESAKVDQLVAEVTQKYGGEIKLYKQFLADFPKTLDQIKKFADEEVKKQTGLPYDKIQDQQLQETMILAVATVQGFPELLQRTQERIDRENKQKIPDYKGVVESVRKNMDALSQMLGQVIGNFTKVKDDAKVPQELRTYAAESLPRFTSTKKIADDVLTRIKSLGELKLDELRQSLRQFNSILVMGESDLKVLPFDSVWKLPANTRSFDTEETPKRQFAGEQQISTAIVALTAKTKPKIVFVRPGGAPLTSAGMMGQGGGPLTDIADRLREYNFDVLEKDMSGQYAMQAQMQGQPVAPEPTDDQIKDAVWVVLSYAPAFGQTGPNPLGPKVAEHLKAGGSALLLYTVGADPLDTALKDWGVEVKTDVIAVHEQVKSGGAQSGDMIEEAQRVPFIFVTSKYGDHPLAKPLNSLESLLVPMLIVKTTPTKDYTATPIIPVPSEPRSWGETDYRNALQGQPVEFNPTGKDGASGDLPLPLWAGAAVEHDKSRVVAIGGLEFITNQMLNIPDRDLLRRGILVTRFPGNAELFTNSIYWLSKMDTMIAISPAAMQVSRIAPMSTGVLAMWRWGVMIVGLPLLVLIAATFVYMGRRD